MKYLIKFAKVYLEPYFALIGTCASIFSVVIIFLPNPLALIFTLSVFILMMCWIFVKIINVLDSFVSSKTSDGYLKFATYVRYSTIDGKHIRYELHKYIQCKKIIMDLHFHEFNWSGSKEPIVTSTQQDFIQVVQPVDKNDLPKVALKFKKPLIYNDISIVEIIMDIDDSDHKSKKFVGHPVKENIHLISFIVELKHLNHSKDAVICRRFLNSVKIQDDEILDYISFDEKSRTYRHNIFNPEPGYIYRLTWGQPLK